MYGVAGLDDDEFQFENILKLFQIRIEYFKALVAFSPNRNPLCSVLFFPSVVVWNWEALLRRKKIKITTS